MTIDETLTLARVHAGKQALRIADLEHDVLCLALRLHGESPHTFAPETANVMEKWRPVVESKLEAV